MTACSHVCEGGDGVMRQCDKPKDHAGWHGETVTLRGAGGSSYESTTNWGDDRKGIHASKGRLIDGHWLHPNETSLASS
jgi:hypothetical protein